jgi:hypothetical protein
MSVKTALRRSSLSALFGTLLLTVGLLIGYSPTALAYSCGDVVYPTSGNWLQGHGVPSRSNGEWEASPTGNSCGSYIHNLAGTPPQYGWGWQCVELAERLYNTNGWFSGSFGVAGAADIYTDAASLGFSTTPQGSITLANVEPGDMLVTQEATYGHVFIVNSVNTSADTISAVDQNGGDGGQSTITYTPSTQKISDGSYFDFSGVVHSSNDPLTNSGSGGGGSITNSPLSAVSMPGGQSMVFWNNGGDLEADYWSGSEWYAQNLGAAFGFTSLESAPSAVYQPSTGQIQVFWQGAGNTLYQAIDAGGTWVGGWSLPVSATVDSQPAAAVDGSEVDVYWKDSANLLTEAWWDGSAWNSTGLGTMFYNMGSAPTAYDQSGGQSDIFWTDTSGNLVEAVWDGSAWSGWPIPVGLISSQPSALLDGSGNNDVFWKDGSNLKEAFYNGGIWNTFTIPYATNMATAPAATASSSQVDVYYTNSSGTLYENVWDGSAWSNWAITNAGTIPPD